MSLELIGLSGSLRQASTNSCLLQAASQLLRDEGAETAQDVTLQVLQVLDKLPAFNPDISPQQCPEVDCFVSSMRSCNGLVISSPVYAGGYPGALKNALDWLVGTDAFVEKPFMMLSASNRMPGVEQSLIAVLETMGGRHIEQASNVVTLLGKSVSVEELLDDADASAAIRQSLLMFIDHLRH